MSGTAGSWAGWKADGWQKLFFFKVKSLLGWGSGEEGKFAKMGKEKLGTGGVC